MLSWNYYSLLPLFLSILDGIQMLVIEVFKATIDSVIRGSFRVLTI